MKNYFGKEKERAFSQDFPTAARTSPLYVLTESEIDGLKADIEAIGADVSVFEFNSKRATGTSYYEKTDKIRIRGNVLPSSDSTSTHPRDLMSARAVLAHEYYGHRPYREQYLQNLSLGIQYDWRDEFRASYMAARNSPGLSDIDRKYLLLDATERARDAGVRITLNRWMMEALSAL